MAIIGYIKRIPVFSTPTEALTWGRNHGLKGYHTHTVNIKTGYMGGKNHSQAMKKYGAVTQVNVTTTTPAPNITTNTQATPPQQQSSPPPPPTTNTPTGGGGGGY
tara:strand:+ start:174 stop:488 length:315 start_codon:yes stop_codon:yes gene_type:complete